MKTIKSLQMGVLVLALSFVATVANAKQLIVVGVDGLSLNAFKAAQKQGLFKEFPSVASHIAPFPTMTDLSWATVLQTGKIFGKAGEIKSVEAVYFDESRKSVEGDVRDYYRRLAQPKYYMGGFQSVFNAYVEGLMYFPTQELPKLEIKTVLDEMATSQEPNLVTGYLGAVDSTAHTQLERLFPVIIELDRQLKNFISEKKLKGDDFEVVLVSDHGNIGRFSEGESEQELIAVELESVLKAGGFHSTQQLVQNNDVAMPLLALGSWAPIYLKDRSRIKSLLEAVSAQPWFDLAYQVIEKSQERSIVEVRGASGGARIHHVKRDNLYYYEILAGNPLQLPVNVQSQGGRFFPLTPALIENLTRKTNYPDSLIRISAAAESRQFDFPDLILTAKDGYYFNNSLGKMTKMYRTHGSLSRGSSLGIVASTARALPEYLRSEEILSTFGLRPEQMFGELGRGADRARSLVIRQAKEDSQGIPTGSKDFSQKRIFQQITKLVANSRPFFVVDEIKSLMSALSVELNPQSQSFGQIRRFDSQKLEAKPIVSPQEIGELTDLVIQKPDLESLQKDPRILSLQKKFGFGADGQKAGALDNPISLLDEGQTKSRTLGLKRVGMKLYQIPYLLDQSLVVQEKPFLKETRDLGFAQYWDTNRSQVISNLDLISQTTRGWAFWKRETRTLVERLFAEIFKEATIEDRISPQVLDSVYSLVPERATIVYVPGTYNGIFDREIFSLGLTSLQEELGLRVLKAPMLSACSSQVNGDLLLDFLKQDQKRFQDRRESPPQYVLLGYSKGGIDALYAFIKDKDFVKKNILGLVAIASPLKGSAVLEKSDLPFQLVNLMIDEKTPEICKADQTATSSVSTQAMSRFWRMHERELIGLTRFFSVSFVSDPEESHLYMKITKAIAQFGEDNDGIVALSASKFPSRLGAIDLGVVQGDHLSGILSSRFLQKAFMRAVVKTLAELGVEDLALGQKLRRDQILRSQLGLIDHKYVIATPRSDLVRLIDITNKSPRLSVKDIQIKDAYDLNTIVLGNQVDPIASYIPLAGRPQNQLNFDPYAVLDLTKLPDVLSTKRVTPASLQNLKSGVDLSFKHHNVIFYRMDHQWNYESRSPVGADNNPKWGLESVTIDKDKWLALRSNQNSIRMTTLAYRFKPTEFSKFLLDLRVTQGPQGADPVKGRSGKDDSAFQVWLTLRDLRGVSDRGLGAKENAKVYLFGYYWGEEVPGENRPLGSLFESYYSNKNVVVTTLPPSFQVVLNNGKEKLGQVINVERNLVEDLKKAYPQLDVNQLEVIAVTIQMDSNDVSGKSEAFMKTLKFVPQDLGSNTVRLAQ